MNNTEWHDNDQAFNAEAFSMIVNATRVQDNEPWLMDSGASHHMTSNRHLFMTYTPLSQQVMIELGNNNIIYAEGKGSICMELDVNGKQMNGVLTDVLYAPEL